MPLATDARGFFAFAQQAGYQGVQLDATTPGLRPRELDTSSRRDLAGVVRRAGIVLSGIDVFIPVADFLDPARVDRAAHAVIAALDFASDLRSAFDQSSALLPLVCVALPASNEDNATVDETLVRALGAHSQRVGVSLVDHGWGMLGTLGVMPRRASPSGGVAARSAADTAQDGHDGRGQSGQTVTPTPSDLLSIGHFRGDGVAVGIDPLLLAMQGSDVLSLLARMARVESARWPGAWAHGGIPPVDALAYAAALGGKGCGALVVDLRSSTDVAVSAQRAVTQFRFGL